MTQPYAHPSATGAAELDAAAMLAALLEHGSSIIFSIDAQWRILSINRTPAGLGQADVLGTSCLDYVPPESQAVARQAFEQVLRTGRPARYEIQARGPNDMPAWYATQVLPLRGVDGTERLLLVSDDISRSLRAESALHLSEARYRAVDEGQFDAAYRMGPDWAKVRRLGGRNTVPEPSEPVGTWLEQRTPPDERARVQAAIDAAVREGRPFELEQRVRRADGSPGWTHSRVVPMLDGQGAITEWIGRDTDVTERREAQLLIAEGEQRLRLVLEAAEEGLWDRNLVTNECLFSPAYYTMLGYPGEGGARQLDFAVELIHPEDRACVQRADELLRDPGHFELRLRMRTAAGDYRWIESRGRTAQRDAQGNPLRAVGTHVDITERLRLEEALRRSEGLLGSIVESTTDLVFVKDLQSRFVLVNRAVCELARRTQADLLGRDVGAFLPEAAARSVADLDRDLMARGEVVSVTETFDWSGGDRRSFFVTKGPLRDANGNVIGMFGIARDLTGLLRQEEAQRRALQDSRDLLDLALGAAELGTWETDIATGRSTYDERYQTMLGYAPGELEPTMQAWQQLIHPDERAYVDEAVAAHVAGESRVFEVEHRLRHKGGHWVWVLARGKVFRDADGTPVRAAGTHQDISDRKRMTTEGTVLLKKVEALIAGLAPRGSPGAHPPSLAAAGTSPPGTRLSARHREVLALLANGLTASEIATRLGISAQTAVTHRRDLMRKLGLRNKAELIRYALQHGVAPVDPD